MENEKKLRIDNFRLMCQDVADFNIETDEPLKQSPERLIGYRHFADIFKGLVPLADYDDRGRFSYLDDFPEIFPNAFPSMQKTGAAVLFTGDTGCGKHTADNTFMSVVYHFVENELIEQMADENMAIIPEASDLDEAMEYYKIDLRAYRANTERQLGTELNELFSQLENKAFAQPAKLFYFSLGDVTRILDSRLLAPRFAEAAARLTESSSARCILTCIYDGRANMLDEHTKKPFYVLELEPPALAEREEYFSFLVMRYPNIRFAFNSNQLAKLTEGFTFAMIKQLAAYLLMTAKSELKRKRLKMNYIRFETAQKQDVIMLEAKTICSYADMLRAQRYSGAATEVYQPAVPQPVAVTAAVPEVKPQPVQTPSEASESGEDDPKNAAKKATESINTSEQMYNEIDKLVVPVNYRQRVLMDHQTFHSSVWSVLSITLDAVLSSCRKKGLTSLANLKAVTVSLGGHLLLHVWDDKLLVPSMSEAEIDYSELIREGRLNEETLMRIGKDGAWLNAQLRKQGCKSEKEVFLGVCDQNNGLIVYKKV